MRHSNIDLLMCVVNTGFLVCYINQSKTKAVKVLTLVVDVQSLSHSAMV